MLNGVLKLKNIMNNMNKIPHASGKWGSYLLDGTKIFPMLISINLAEYNGSWTALIKPRDVDVGAPPARLLKLLKWFGRMYEKYMDKTQVTKIGIDFFKLTFLFL